MNFVTRLVFIFVLAFGFFSQAQAQVPAGYRYCNGVWMPGSCGGGEMLAPQGFPQMQIQQQRPAIPPGCYVVQKQFFDRVKDGAGEALLSALVGGLVGAAVDTDRNTGGRYTSIGASAGAAWGLGSSLGNDKTVVCPVAQQQQQQQQTTTMQSECKVDGMSTIFGVTLQECDRIRRSVGQNSSTTSQQPSPTEEASATGCGVKLAGQLVKELPEKAGTTCQSRRNAFVAQFMQRCQGKTGSLQGDIACGRQIDI